jgi:hypothetical protein
MKPKYDSNWSRRNISINQWSIRWVVFWSREALHNMSAHLHRLLATATILHCL